MHLGQNHCIPVCACMSVSVHAIIPVCVSGLIALDFNNLCSVVMISSLRQACQRTPTTHTHTQSVDSSTN